jgi:DNA-binding CsgD family transcriptional regulator
MESLKRPDRVLALAVIALSALWLLTAVSFPVPARKMGRGAAMLIMVLAALHTAAYWNADKLREQFRFAGYVMIQLAIVFAIAMSGALYPFGLVLLLAFTARSVAGRSVTTGAMVTLSSFGTFLLAAIATSDLYRGATAGLMLAATGIVAYSISLAVTRRPVEVHMETISAPAMGAAPRASNGRATELTSREREVLRAVASGSRTADIALGLGITERTVKAHLATIYQKLGVENRAGAIAVAMRSNLL